MTPHVEGIWLPIHEQNHNRSAFYQLQLWSSQNALQKNEGTLQPSEEKCGKGFYGWMNWKGRKKLPIKRKKKNQSIHRQPTITILLSPRRLLASSEDFISTVAGPLCFFRYSTIPSASRAPLYSWIDFPPFLKILRVGKPLISYSDASSLLASSLASTFARMTGGSWLLSIEAAFSYYKIKKHVHVNEMRIQF